MTTDEIDAYDTLIDGLVELNKRQSLEARVTSHGWPLDVHFSDNEQRQSFNSLLDSLTPDQKEIVAVLMKRARRGGIHDVVVFLEDYDITSPDDVIIPRRPYRQSRLDDLYGRFDGDSWD